MAGCLVGCLVGQLVGCLVGCLVGWLVSCLVGQLIGCLVGCLVVWLIFISAEIQTDCDFLFPTVLLELCLMFFFFTFKDVVI